ncbi:band 7 protein [[Leptolyngbya] sp. PCC 7376]|uniref:flotillin family protein n=1 Tax=[Leptolyngbya] sp. PCC 7376 TaxID=111781 RepID=UPI00029F2590|nr:flotillin domain-containing protein [[Leptolyngbya] sp. PCC 7376]AFY37123.1 band 7 protein [[Leptolyngbya] sp. PCC 7376]
MKFWLTFLQTLPELTDSELNDIRESDLFAQRLETSETAIATVGLNSTTPTSPAFIPLGGAVVFPGIIVTLIVLFLMSVWAYTRVYVITPNNEAFVRTGGVIRKKKTVILNGGCIVLPGFHELTRVPLREISIDVERTGNLAVRTQDYLRANMRVTFYVCINAKEEDVLVSAARLSKQGRISEDDIKDALEKRADDAIRAAAKRKSIAEIDSDKLGFADEVLNLIQQDLKKVGLTLNNIAISEIEESDTYDENNFFDAQGVRLRTETIQKSIKQKLEVELSIQKQKRELQLNTKVEIEEQELAAEQKSLKLAKSKEEAKLDQAKAIEFLKAQQAQEIQAAQDQELAKIERNKILQEKAVEEEKIQQKLSIQQNQIAADIELEEQNKALKVARTQQQQQAEIAEINRQKTINASQLKAQVAVAEAQQESQIAKEEAAIAIANKEKERFAAEAERTQAEEAVSTAQAVEQAEREQRLAIIDAEKDANQKRIADQNVVEIDVFRRRRQAEIARQAAELEAESIRTLAEANRYKALADAQGKQAIIEAENALSNANRTAELIKLLMPTISEQLPEIMRALAPQPGVLGDAKIFAMPGGGANGEGSGIDDINKLLLSTSGISLLNTFLNEGKLGELLGQVKTFLNDNSVDAGSSEILENIESLLESLQTSSSTSSATSSSSTTAFQPSRVITPPPSDESTGA